MENISSKLSEHGALSRLSNARDANVSEVGALHTEIDSCRSSLFKVQDNNIRLRREATELRKRNDMLESSMKNRESAFLSVLVRVKAMKQKDRDKEANSAERRENQEILNALEDSVVENEHLSEEVFTLRSSILHLSEVIEHLEYNSLEKDYEMKKMARKLQGAQESLSSSAKAGQGNSITTKSPPQSTQRSSKQKLSELSPSASGMSSRLAEREKKAKAKSSENEEKKSLVTSMISSWFSGEAEQQENGKLDEHFVDDDPFQSAARDAATKAELEFSKMKMKRKEEQRKKSLKLQDEEDKNKFFAAAKKLKSGPGKMVVALTKCEREVEYLKSKLQVYEEREKESRKLLAKAEETMLTMVKNVESEALSLAEMDYMSKLPPVVGMPDSKTVVKGPASPLPPDNQAAEKIHQLSKKVEELERQRSTLLDMMNDYEEEELSSLAGMSPDTAHLSLFSPDKEVAAALKGELCDCLDLGGEVSDDDLIKEIRSVVQERGSLLAQVGDLEQELKIKKVKLHRATNFDAKDADEGAVGDGADTPRSALSLTTPRSDSKSQGFFISKVESAPVEEKEVSNSRLSPDELQINRALTIQESKSKERAHTVHHSTAAEAVVKAKETEAAAELAKAEAASRVGQRPTFLHRSAATALESFKEQDAAEDDNDNDSDDDDDDEYEDDFSKEGDDDGDGGEGDAASSTMMGSTTPKSLDISNSMPYDDIQSEEIQHPGMKLLIHTNRMYEDPLGNHYSFTMTSYNIPGNDEEGLGRFRIKAYDAEVTRELCMDLNENELRQCLKHDPSSFTYDLNDKRFHEKVLDRLRLIPGHDVNNDGFLNADDVKRDDLSFALVAEGQWQPIKITIEVGKKAREKKRLKMLETERQRKEMESALNDHRLHSERLIEKERKRSRERAESRRMSERDTLMAITKLDSLTDSHVKFESSNALIFAEDGHAEFVRHGAKLKEYREGQESRMEGSGSSKAGQEDKESILRQIAGEPELSEVDVGLAKKVVGRDTIARIHH